MYLSPSFMHASHPNLDPNRFVRQNFSPKLLSEAHLTDTTTNDMADFLKRFFHAQWLVCKAFACPLVMKTDCAKGLCAAVFMALTQDGNTVATRVMYNNCMLIVLAYCATLQWDATRLEGVLAFVLTMIPCFRAGWNWINDKKRCPTVTNNRHLFKDLVVDWLRQCTCTISLSEAIVNVALIIYSLEVETIEVTKNLVLPDENLPPPDIYGKMNGEIIEFMSEAVEWVQKELSTEYDALVSGGDISSVAMVVSIAQCLL